MSKPKVLFLLIGISMLVSGWSIWSTDNYMATNEIVILSAIALILGVSFRVLISLNFWGIWFASLTGIFIALIIKLMMNYPIENNAHSLSEKDIIIEMAAVMVTTFAGIALGYIVKRYQEKHSKYK